MNEIDLWVFGYGSLLWRPDFVFECRQTATITGWERRLWQGSTDHRGTPASPGRVVTLAPAGGTVCTGRLYGVAGALREEVLGYLDHRESGGYHRLWVTVSTAPGVECRALTYVALPGNPHYLGPAASAEIVTQIRTAAGPSGTNMDYLRLLASELAELEVGKGEWSTLGVSELLRRL